MSLHLEEVDLRDTVQQAVGGVTGSGAHQRVELRTGDADGTAGTDPLIAWGDRRRIAQILRNLLQNAIAHSPVGESVRVLTGGDDRAVRVTVVDRGPGIPPEHQTLVWNRFHRIDAARARGAGGVGLGLAIVKSLVEAQGGTVGLESAPGSGAAFYFTLPRSDATITPTSPRHAGNTASSGR